MLLVIYLLNGDKNMRQQSFTLIEMIAVMAICAMLVVITISSMKTEPQNADLARIGGACTFANATSIKKNKPVLIELRQGEFKASYVDDSGTKIIFKQFSLLKKVEAKIVRAGEDIESYTIYKGQISGGNAVTFKIRKAGAVKAAIIWINAFTGRVSYYDSDGASEVAW